MTGPCYCAGDNYISEGPKQDITAEELIIGCHGEESIIKDFNEGPTQDHITADPRYKPFTEKPCEYVNNEDLITENPWKDRINEDNRQDTISDGSRENHITEDPREDPREDPSNEDTREDRTMRTVRTSLSVRTLKKTISGRTLLLSTLVCTLSIRTLGRR